MHPWAPPRGKILLAGSRTFGTSAAFNPGHESHQFSGGADILYEQVPELLYSKRSLRCQIQSIFRGISACSFVVYRSSLITVPQALQYQWF